MSEHIEKLNSLQDNITEYTRTPFPGVIISKNSSESTLKVVLISGIHAGYIKNQEFLYTAISSIKESFSDPDFSSNYSSFKFYFFPIFNEPAHNAMYEAYNATKEVSIFKTDLSNLESCNETKDAGVNPNHNFDEDLKYDSYSDICNTNYSKAEKIEMVKSFVKFIEDESPAILIHLHRDKNTYVKALINSTEESTGLLKVINEEISGVVPDGMNLKNNFDSFGEVETGTLIDFCAVKGVIAVQVGIEDKVEDHLKFFYDVVELALPDFKVDVFVEVESQGNNSAKSNETEDIEKIVRIKVEIEDLTAVSFEGLNIYLDFDYNFDSQKNIDCSIIVNSEYHDEIKKDCVNDFKLSKSSNVLIDLPAFGKFVLEAEVLVNVKEETEECTLNVAAKGLFDSDKVKCSFSHEEDESDDSSDDNPSNIIKMTTKNTYTISASIVLISLNILLVLVGVCWKFKNNSG
jgi:hypothetical protein